MPKKKKQKKSKVSLLIVLAVFGYFSYILISQQSKINDKNADMKNIQGKISAQERQNEQLDQQKEELNSDEYIKKTAREKLNMVNDGDKIFVDIDD